MDELFPIVDENGNQIGSASRSKCHSGSMLLHPVVHLHLYNPAKGLYLQQRNHNKDIQPDKWDTSVGGHVDYGETIDSALKRESREELGLSIDKLTIKRLNSYVFQSDRERELINPFIAIANDDIEPNPNQEEIQAGRFWQLSEISENIGRNVFTPNFEQEYKIIRVQLNNL